MRHVNLSAVQHILALCNKEDQSVANVAAELVKVLKKFKILEKFSRSLLDILKTKKNLKFWEVSIQKMRKLLISVYQSALWKPV